MVKIGVSRTDSWISKLIIFFGKRQTGDARFSHAFLLIDNSYVIESTFYGLRIRDYKRYKNIPHEIYMTELMHENQSNEIKKQALIQVGTYEGIYGYAKLPLFALDAIFKTYWFSQHIGSKHFKVCSQFIGWLFKDYAIWEWRSLTPDGIDDYCKKSKLFKLVDRTV